MISGKTASKKDSDKDDSMGDESTGAVPTNTDSHAHRRPKTRYRRGDRMFITTRSTTSSGVLVSELGCVKSSEALATLCYCGMLYWGMVCSE